MIKKLLLSVPATIIIVFSTIFFLDISHRPLWQLGLFGSIVLVVTLMQNIAQDVTNKHDRLVRLYNHDIPNALADLVEEVRREMNLRIRLAYFVFNKKTDSLLIPGSCSCGLKASEEKVIFEEGEGIVGYLYLFRQEIDSGIMVDMERYSKEQFAPRIRKQNADLVDERIKWIFAWEVSRNNQCYGILSVDSVEDSWPYEQDEKVMEELVNRVRHKAYKIVSCHLERQLV
jgi:hypothetical protein